MVTATKTRVSYGNSHWHANRRTYKTPRRVHLSEKKIDTYATEFRGGLDLYPRVHGRAVVQSSRSRLHKMCRFCQFASACSCFRRRFTPLLREIGPLYRLFAIAFITLYD